MTKDPRTCEQALILLTSWINTQEVFLRLGGMDSVEDIPSADFGEDELPDWITTSFICRLAEQLSSMVTTVSKKDRPEDNQIEQSAFDEQSGLNSISDLNELDVLHESDANTENFVIQEEALRDSRV